jgi:mannitol 2-dehydrogenase
MNSPKADIAKANNSSAVALRQGSLHRVNPRVKTPKYDRTELKTGIVHLGFGGFHRAHMARYTHDLMEMDPSALSWGIAGVGLMPADKKNRDNLAPQDGLYTLVERDGKHEHVAVIGSISQIIYAGESTAAVVAEIEKASTRIVSLTVTENGYCLNPVAGTLDHEHALIKKDLATPEQPHSAIGVIVESYRRRRDRGMPAFTSLSCDNIQHNGHVLHDAVMALAQLRDPSLAQWIGKNASFPNTMVDRITPVTKLEDIDYIRATYQIDDRWPVICEGFTQWVIEDKFVAGRPAWEKVGAQFVPDVGPYEVMKLRLLNASHLAVACLGDLAGYTYIHETMSDPRFRIFMAALMDKETGPTLAPVPGIDLPVYKKTLIERFANPAIKDTVERVTSDALLNTVLASIRDRLKANQSVDLLTLALAGWMRRLRGDVNEKGREISVRHPMVDVLKAKATEGGVNPASLLSITQLFGDLGQDQRLVQPLQRHLASIYEAGSLKTLETALKGYSHCE